MGPATAWCVVLLLAGLADGPAALKAGTVTTVHGNDGLLFAISPGVPGECSPVEHGIVCTGGRAHRAAAFETTGCGEITGWGSCIVYSPEGGDAADMPRATNTLVCADRETAYRLSLEVGDGRCAPGPEPGTMTCTDPTGKHTARASCVKGCGPTTGSGGCRVDRLPPRAPRPS